MGIPILGRIVGSQAARNIGYIAKGAGGRVAGAASAAISPVRFIASKAGKNIPRFGRELGGTVGAAALPLAGALAFRGISGAAEASYSSIRNTGLINPFFYGRRVHHGYGKRGMDANNQSTDGLVQGLHRNRRSQR
jgi:hypothetical protein